MNLISFSLFGSVRNYNLGMVENARIAPLIYPGWKVRVYADERITVADELLASGVEIVWMPREEHSARAMCWRFLAAADENVDRVIVRDADSRLNVREAAAVCAWVESGKPFHVMRDHEHHRSWPIYGGMWGCVGGLFPDMRAWIDRWGKFGDRLDDMLLLAGRVWPLVANDACQHESVKSRWGGDPFPDHPRYEGFVGERIDP